MLAKEVLTEEWLADALQDSLDMDWTPKDGARAIMRALEDGQIAAPPVEGFKWPEPKFLPVQSGTELNPARVTAAFEFINRELVVGEQFRLVEMLLDGTEYTVAAPPVEGLTSGEEWQLVPVEPTDAMWDAFDAHNGDKRTGYDTWRKAWSAMLAAAPKATATASVREPWPGCTADMERRRVVTLAKVGQMLSIMAGGEAAEVEGYDAGDLYAEVLMSLGVEDAAFPDLALQGVEDDPEAYFLTDSGTAATIGGERA